MKRFVFPGRAGGRPVRFVAQADQQLARSLHSEQKQVSILTNEQKKAKETTEIFKVSMLECHKNYLEQIDIDKKTEKNLAKATKTIERMKQTLAS